LGLNRNEMILICRLSQDSSVGNATGLGGQGPIPRRRTQRPDKLLDAASSIQRIPRVGREADSLI
jgi:hypothetical protein